MFKKIFVFGLLFLMAAGNVWAEEKNSSSTATSSPTSGQEKKVVMYFFWGDGCPHCAAAKPFLEELKKKYPRLEIKAYEVFYNKNNKYFWEAMAQAYGTTAEGVPSFFIGNRAWSGYDSSSEDYFYEAVEKCLKKNCPSPLEKLIAFQKLSGNKEIELGKIEESKIENSGPSSRSSVSFLKYIVLGAILFGVLYLVFKE